jgi:hypothetical protein
VAPILSGQIPMLLVTRNGKRLHNELENHHAIDGKIHYFDWAIFNSYVSLPEGNDFSDTINSFLMLKGGWE